MSLIPFILDLADELHEFNRCLATGMDVDDFGFGIYPQELQHQYLTQKQSMQRRPRTVSQLYWLPSSKQRPHPYNRSKACCGKPVAVTAATSPSSSSWATAEVDNSREATAVNGAGQDAVSASGASIAGATAKSAYSVVNKNGFQVSMNVKQFAPNELTVKTIDNCIVVEGQHEDKEDGHGVISRHFIRKYMLPKGYDPIEVLSTLSSDGILTVKAPPPPATKTDTSLERIVDIQQAVPAHLLGKESSKEQTKTPVVTVAGGGLAAAITTAANQQQKQQQQQELQKVNEHNGAANDNNNTHAAPINADSPTSVDVKETEEMPVPAANNIVVVAPAAIDAIMAIAIADEHSEDANAEIGVGVGVGCGSNSDSGINSGMSTAIATKAAAVVFAAAVVSTGVESNGGTAVVPVAAADIPVCSDVAVAMETETSDISKTSTALSDSANDSVSAMTETKDGHNDGVGVAGESSAAAENLVVATAAENDAQPTPTAAGLVAAADAAILLAKAHRHSSSVGENGNKAAAIPEKVAN